MELTQSGTSTRRELIISLLEIQHNLHGKDQKWWWLWRQTCAGRLSLMSKPSRSSLSRRPTDWTQYSNPHLALKSTAKYFPSLPVLSLCAHGKGGGGEAASAHHLLSDIANKNSDARSVAHGSRPPSRNPRLGFPAHSYSPPATRCQMDCSGAAEQRPTWVRLSPLSCVSWGAAETAQPHPNTQQKRRGVIEELNGLYNQDVRVKV